MSAEILCDSCRKIIYPDQYSRSRVAVTVLESRYERGQREFVLDLCKECDWKVAHALHPLLPRLAFAIEANAARESR